MLQNFTSPIHSLFIKDLFGVEDNKCIIYTKLVCLKCFND